MKDARHEGSERQIRSTGASDAIGGELVCPTRQINVIDSLASAYRIRPEAARNGARVKVNFVNGIKPIGFVSRDNLNFLFPKIRNCAYLRASRLGMRGVRVVTNARRDAMDARGVTRRTTPTWTAKACGYGASQ